MMNPSAPFKGANPSADVVSRLRIETQSMHCALESALNLMRPDFSRFSYAALLSRFHALYVPIENQIELWRTEWENMRLDWPRRRKVPLLKHDLASLEASTEAMSEPLIPALGSVERALGCLYVLEGATLGGQLLSKHFEQSLGLTPETGTAFFTAYGAQTGPRWKAFQAILGANLTDDDSQAAAVQAARETFASFSQWLPDGGS